jgi:Ca2+-binding RTX toxin-like protein
MKVDGESSPFGYGFFSNEQQHREATVTRGEDPFSVFGFGRSGAKLTIDAGAGDDDIRVSKKGPDEYLVTVNGQEFTLTKEEMKNLEIKGGAGNDRIIIDPSVDVAIQVDGGKGDDQILNFADRTRITGGSGSDFILNTGKDVEIDRGASSFFDLLFGQRAQVVDLGTRSEPKDPFAGLFGRD